MRGLLLAALVTLTAGCVSAPASVTHASALAPLPAHLAWHALAPAPTPRAEHSVALLDGRIYAIGGFPASNDVDGVAPAAPPPGVGPLAGVDVYDIKSAAWSKGPDYPVPVDHAPAAASHGRVFVFFGADSYALDPASGAWRAFAAPPFPVAAADADPATGLIYVAEWGGNGANGSAAVYDPVADGYAALPDYPTPRNHVASAFAGGAFLLANGDVGGHTRNTADTVRYDITKGAWTHAAPNPTLRGSAAGAEWRGRFVVLGGQAQGTGTPLDASGVGRTGPPAFAEVDAYDAATDAWTKLPDLPHGRHGFGAVAFEGKLYAVEGAPQQGYSGFADLSVLDSSG